MIAVETYIPVQCISSKQLLIPPSTTFSNLDFHKADWPNILLALQFHRERKKSSTKSNTQIIKIEQSICDSHLKDKLNEESIAVAKIKSDPIFILDMLRNLVYVRVIFDIFKPSYAITG